MIRVSFSAWWLARHEEDIRERERALALRRLQPLLVVPEPQETDFPGCVE